MTPLIGDVKGSSWADLVVVGILAALSLYFSTRVWSGKPLNPHNSPEWEERIRFLIVGLPPASIMFSSAFVLGITIRIYGYISRGIGRDVVLAIQSVAIAFGIAAGLISFALIMTGRPRSFLPPPFRQHRKS
jgi:Na+-driven multidrug efflux pump